MEVENLSSVSFQSETFFFYSIPLISFIFQVQDSSIKEFQILQVSCATPIWSLKHLNSVDGNCLSAFFSRCVLSSTFFSSEVHVCPLETNTMCLKAEPVQGSGKLVLAFVEHATGLFLQGFFLIIIYI
jgi:hypothetical protein